MTLKGDGLNNIGIHSFTQLGSSFLKANYFVEGANGNFLLGDASLLDNKANDFCKAKGGLLKVFNLEATQNEAMTKCFSLFGCAEVRVDSEKSSEYPIQELGKDYVHTQISHLSSHQLNHILLYQRKRYVLFLDPKIRLRHHQLVSQVSPVELTQSLLKVMEKVDFCAAFYTEAGGSFFPLLPGLLPKKIDQMIHSQ